MNYEQIAAGIKEILGAVREKRKVSDVLFLILERACLWTNALHGAFLTMEASTGRLIITSTQGPDWTLARQAVSFKTGEGIIGLAAQSGLPHLGGGEPSLKSALFEGMLSEITIPVFVNKKVWGVIFLDSPFASAFQELAIDVLAILSEVAAFAIATKIDIEESDTPHQQKVESARQALLATIIAGIAHEINNPLTSILSHASLLTLKRGGEADEASVRTILEEAGRVSEIVKNLRSFSPEENSPKEICGLNEIINQAISIKKIQLQGKNIKLVSELDPFSPQIMGSASQLQQVILHLLDNAEQAIPLSRQDGFIKISLTRTRKKAKVIIADNGMGIPPEQQKMIFDPFFSTKPVGSGSGLGLTKAHAIIEEHGGELSLIESSSLGTSFTFELPFALSTDTYLSTYAENLKGKAPPRPQPIGKVLIVDDEPDILRSMADYLRMQNIDAKEVSSGSEALELLRQSPFDVVVSDLRMPGIDGIQLYQQIVAIDARYEKSFIFMSGDLMRESNRSFIDTTGCPCLEKPFSLATLHQHLLAYLTGSKKSYSVFD